jgi:hypothetical protein
MRKRRTKLVVSLLGMGVTSSLVLGLALAPARAQIPEPTVPELNKRSGLLTRFVPIDPHLPADRKRDQWYHTRWGDPPNEREHPNWYFNGGLYGLPWRADCTVSYYPFFFGSPGQSTMTPDCKPPHSVTRLISTYAHPFKPVGYYYDQGSLSPVYDLDPVVPGPGPWPWRWFRPLTSWGG